MPNYRGGARCSRAGQRLPHRGMTPEMLMQAEMDQLVEAAGFEKIEQRIDEWGIFTVSLARRKA